MGPEDKRRKTSCTCLISHRFNFICSVSLITRRMHWRHTSTISSLSLPLFALLALYKPLLSPLLWNIKPLFGQLAGTWISLQLPMRYLSLSLSLSLSVSLSLSRSLWIYVYFSMCRVLWHQVFHTMSKDWW